MVFKLIGTYTLDQPTGTCEHCGRGIKHEFYIVSETGKRMIVGGECVVHLVTADQAATVELLERRAKRAATQWRKRDPLPLPGETRAEYINRRVKEMGNALKAHKMMLAVNHYFYNRWRNSTQVYDAFIARLMRMNGVEKPQKGDPNRENYSRMYHILHQFQQSKREDRTLRWIEAKCGANRYDFANKKIWEVRKI